ncbi:Ubiquitin carboxyl-terminal hydrolase 36 [Apophysomyces ossiformis]|uniref:ubiquitinyl hydrolase 1 n=1 Tax=Apophysomyces ossiformis TaxID=679940 RepID=A0A8H7ES68_9FUNG|nr:Ubiquitin carboxyl-terminal hydrolase 36 [Apophysomyces ossiformis]
MTKNRADLVQNQRSNSKDLLKKKTIASGKELFSRHKLKPQWTFSHKIGPGLVNGQNTCFLNSVLQCLTYTPPLAQYLLDGTHRKECAVKGYCALCCMETHVFRCFKGNKSNKPGAAILPRYFTSNLRELSPTLRLRRQEDAHEFLMFLLSAIQKSSLHGLGKVNPKLEETTLLHQIFGGRIQSQLRCQRCKAVSNTYEPFLDISVDLHGAKSLENALKNFIKVDIIGGKDPANRYKCDACKQMVIAGKQMTIHRLPTNLTIHLKRFAFDLRYGSMRKVMNTIKYPEFLDMSPYVSKEKNINRNQSRYRLYAVLVHFGVGCSSGHYYAYVKNSSGKWYRMDDEDVSPVSTQEVFSQQAYILFYERDSSRESGSIDAVSSAKQKENHSIQPEHQNLQTPVNAPEQTSNHMAEKQAVAKKRTKRDNSDEQLANPKRHKVEAISASKNPKEDTTLANDTSITALRQCEWIVRSIEKSNRSLRGELSPPTFSAAMGDKDSWLINAESTKRQSNASKSPKRKMVWKVSDIQDTQILLK